MNLFLCIPTLNRYDLLEKTIRSAEAGRLFPDRYFIIDNGGSCPYNELEALCKGKMIFYKPGRNIGVAGSWNVFMLQLLTTPAKVVISNDDLEFYEDSLEILVNSYDENFISYPSGVPSANSFSCFLLPQPLYKTVGRFDETISPGYGYFEDNDYHLRMKQNGFDLKGIPNCRLDHIGSATIKKYTPQQMIEHHKKFGIAQSNYIKKWGGLPGKEIFSTPYNA